MNYDKLNQLNDLRQKGAISEEEYQREKDRLLNNDYALKTVCLALMSTHIV